MNDTKVAPCKVVLKDKREFFFDERPTHLREGIFFRKESGEEEVFSSANVLYVIIHDEEYGPMSGMWPGCGDRLKIEFTDGDLWSFEDALIVGQGGYWWVTDVPKHMKFMIPVSSVLRFTKEPRNG